MHIVIGLILGAGLGLLLAVAFYPWLGGERERLRAELEQAKIRLARIEAEVRLGTISLEEEAKAHLLEILE